MTQVHYTYDLNPKGNDAISNISAHAEYRREDYFFARNQSRTLRALEWEHREKPRSRTPRFVALAILMIVCGLGILSWQQGGIRTAVAAADTHRPQVDRSLSDLNLEADR
jgi:cytochrome c-type biogenesis protein CcmH/NrfG